MIFFTSDTHFGHKNILHLGKGRPFSSIDEHDEALIENWNAVVEPDDTVYHLGDISFHGREKTDQIFRQLNGLIYVVSGNHDKYIPALAKWNKTIELPQCKKISIDGQRIILAHYPLLDWEGGYRGTWHFHGHTHGTINDINSNTTRIDVGVDVWDFTPVDFETLAYILEAQSFAPVGHHDPARLKESSGN